MATTDDKILCTVVLLREELIRHTKDAAWLIGRSSASKTEQPDKDNNYLLDVFERTFQGDGNDDTATRILNLAYWECAHQLRNWVGNKLSTPVAYSDKIAKPEVYSLELTLDTTWAVESVRFLQELLHNLLVYTVLYKWCELVAPEFLEILGSELTELRSKMQDILSTSNEGSARTLWPYPLG